MKLTKEKIYLLRRSVSYLFFTFLHFLFLKKLKIEKTHLYLYFITFSRYAIYPFFFLFCYFFFTLLDSYYYTYIFFEAFYELYIIWCYIGYKRVERSIPSIISRLLCNLSKRLLNIAGDGSSTETWKKK